MKYKNWDNFKVHVTGISKIMSRPKGFNDLTQKDVRRQVKLLALEEKDDEALGALEFLRQKREKFLNPPLSETAKGYLIDRYAAEKYNIRRASSGGKQRATITKGVALENEGIELVSFLDKIKYQQPDCPASNDYMIGQCDILCYENKRIVDVKTSWNAANFMNNRKGKLSFYNWCQMQGYLELYDIDFGQVSFVLVNTPPHLIDQEKANLFRRYTFGEITREVYDEQVEKYDSIFDYSKIPPNKRIIRFDVPRFREFIPNVYNKIDKCREYLNEFERLFLSNKNVITLPENYVTPPKDDNTESDTDDAREGDSE